MATSTVSIGAFDAIALTPGHCDPVEFSRGLVRNAWTLLQQEVGDQVLKQIDRPEQVLTPILEDRLGTALSRTLSLEKAILAMDSAPGLDMEPPERRVVRSAASLFAEYPVLPQVLSDLAASWLRSFASSLRLFAADCHQLGAGTEFRVVDVTAPNTFGICQFDEVDFTLSNGSTVGLRHRGVEADQLLDRVMVLAAESGAAPPFASRLLLARDSHGWIRIPQRRTCEDDKELAAYVERLGALMAVLTFLGAASIEPEDLVPAGPEPFLLRASTLLLPQVFGDNRKASNCFEKSLDTLIWLAGGTDTSRFTHCGHTVAVSDVIEPLRKSFARTLRWLHGESDCIYCLCDKVTTEAVMRPRSTYRRIEEARLHPDALRSSAAFIAPLEKLSLAAKKCPEIAVVLDAEYAALGSGRFPAFDILPRGQIRDRTGNPVFSTQAGTALLRQALAQRNLYDLVTSCDSKLSTSTRLPQFSCVQPRTAIAHQNELLPAVAKLSRALLLEAPSSATTIGGQFDLWHGSLPRLIAMAYAGSAFRDAELTGTAEGASDSLRRTLQQGPVTAYQTLAAAYALAHVAVLWDNEKLLFEAIAAASAVSSDDFVGDNSLIAGRAGMILLLLSLYHCGPVRRLLSTALRIGHSLACSAMQSPGLGTGMAEGTAGIAYALLELYKVTGLGSFRHFAMTLLERDAASMAFDGSGFHNWYSGAAGILFAHSRAAALLGSLGDRPPLAEWTGGLANCETGDRLSLGFGEIGALCVLRSLGELDLRLFPGAEGIDLLPSLEAMSQYSGSAPKAGLLKGTAGMVVGGLYLANPERYPLLLNLGPPLLW